MTKQFILVAIKGEHHQPILGPAIAEIIQTAKTRLKSNYKGWILQVRTIQGYKAKPILTSDRIRTKYKTKQK